jgi:hypothetical protein
MQICRACKVVLRQNVQICPKCHKGIIPNNGITEWYASHLLDEEGFQKIECDPYGREWAKGKNNIS